MNIRKISVLIAVAVAGLVVGLVIVEKYRSYPAIKLYTEHHVRPYNPTWSACRAELREVGGTEQLVSICQDEYEYPRHPFFEYENHKLAAIAHSDSLAALILSERIGTSDPEKALALAVRAAAISGKPGPLMSVAANTFPMYAQESSAPADDPLVVEQHVVLAFVADRMGHPFAIPVPRIPKGIELDDVVLQQRVFTLMQEMADIQFRVTGSTDLKERFEL